MVCERCGREFDEKRQDFCGFCKTVHTEQGKAIRDIGGILGYIAKRFGKETLLDRRKTDALIADIFPKESAVRRLAYVALYDGCAARLYMVRGKSFEVRSAAAARCVKSLRDEIGLKGRIAAEAVEAVGQALGCDIAFKKAEKLPAYETESRKNITDSAEQYTLGQHFNRLKEYEKAYYWFEQSALQDHGEAEYYVGYYKMEGIGTERDVFTAREWFIRSAENGVPAGQYMVGYFYVEGIACEVDEQAAFKWFLKAAEGRYPDAVKFVAMCYETGNYVEKNPEAARKWKAVLDGNSPIPSFEEEQKSESPENGAVPENTEDGEALYRTARKCLANKNYTDAAEYYKKAAELGHARAQCSYGKCLYLGTGVEKDTGEAFKWFTAAAEQNLDIAQYNLGVMYLKGVFVAKSRTQAAKYFGMAAENGHAEAAKILEKLRQS